ncbi:FAD-dependent oxidoreductase [Pelomonas sp. SE-A7]|uniref:FAD-dependent oxidoreductase n=1 Tax=Pelomonas sp. SE-A7 TaxID=3054953 RepID=UPI00259CB605|nr:FAD-dependent oxidoreductase [Pelomonas sp. SE-A7]MDM4767880.1 FAD-dependent oxidoreductase [Pelomonas sp. SE-A7]
MARIAIAGAGLAGRLFAWALVRAGHEVEVFDPSPGPAPEGVPRAAGFSAAGLLSPLAEQDSGADADMVAAGWRSLQLWPRICAALPLPVRMRREGSLLLAHREDLGAAQRMLQHVASARPLDEATLRELEPALVPGLRAWRLEGEGFIDAPAAMTALHQGAAAARWQWGQAVSEIGPGRLRLADGRRIEADWAIDCRGLGARPALPLRGVRGEILTLELSGHGLRRPLRLLHPRHRLYLVPRSESTLILGASEIESEDLSPVSLRSAVELMAAAHSVMPTLAEARIHRMEVNLRPALPDHRPALNSAPGQLNINGLYRHGFLLGPALVQELLVRSGLGTLEEER